MNGTNSSATNFIKTCTFLNDRENLIIKFPSDTSVLQHIILLVISIILMFSTIILNGLTVAAIWLCGQLKAKVFCFTVMLKSVVDLAIGVVVLPVFITLVSKEIARNPTCVDYFISKKVGVLLYVYTVTLLCVLNIERYLAILHPTTHRNKVTKKLLLKYTTLAVILQTVLFALSITEVQVFPYVLATATLLLIATTVFVYTRIFLSQAKLRVEIGRVAPLHGQAENTGRMQMRKMLDDLKLAKALFLVVVCFLACFLPSTISYMDRLNIQPTFSLIVRRRWFALLVVLSTTLSPMIFFWRNSALRVTGIASIKRYIFSH